MNAEFSTAIGLKRRIDEGETFDVIVLTPSIVDDLEAKGVVAKNTRVDIARTGVGVGVPANAPKADVSTPEGLKRTILAAKTVAYTAEGQSRATVDKALATLGIADVVAKKAMVTGPGEGPASVAAGKADLVMTLISEILVPGVQLLGPFPEQMQTYIVFTAAKHAKATDPAADALVHALAGPVLARETSIMAATQAGLFTPLGQGDVDIAGVVSALESRGYDGWYVIEQDTAITDGLPPEGQGPVTQVRTSLDYLRDVVAPTL